MIEIARSYSQHTLIGVIAEGLPAFVKTSLTALVNGVAREIIFKIAVSIPLFYLDHNLFAFGFVVGFIFDKQVRILVEKVNIVYSAQKTFPERVLFFGGSGILAILAMPTSMITANLYYSSQWGAELLRNSKARYQKNPSENESQTEGFLEEKEGDGQITPHLNFQPEAIGNLNEDEIF